MELSLSWYKKAVDGVYPDQSKTKVRTTSPQSVVDITVNMELHIFQDDKTHILKPMTPNIRDGVIRRGLIPSHMQ